MNMSCKCQVCGKQYKIDIHVSDEVWEIIKPEGKPKGAGLLCGSCIVQRLEALGNYDSLMLIKSNKFCLTCGKYEGL